MNVEIKYTDRNARMIAYYLRKKFNSKANLPALIKLAVKQVTGEAAKEELQRLSEQAMSDLQSTRGASPDDAGSARSLMGRQETPVSLSNGADEIPVCRQRKSRKAASRQCEPAACRVGCALPA